MRIAIGLGENKNVLKAIEKFPYDFEIAKSNEELLNYVHDPNIDGVVRGSLESNIILDLKKEYPLKNLEKIKVSYEKIKLKIKKRYREINHIIQSSKKK